MQFEELENKIREAASHHHPPYDEKAWAGMEKLLDKHLPVEKNNRRRIIFFLLLFLLLGGAGTWLLSNKSGNEKRQETMANTTVQSQNGDKEKQVTLKRNPNDDNKSKNSEGAGGIHETSIDKTSSNPAEPVTAFVTPGGHKERQNKIPVIPGGYKKINPVYRLKDNYAGPSAKNSKKNGLSQNQPDQLQKNNITSIAVPDQKDNNNNIKTENKVQVIVANNTKPSVNEPQAEKGSNKENILAVQPSPEKKKKDKNKKGNSFFFSLSAGPDVSATPGDQLGKTKLLVGGGLGYTIRDRLTIRSGFYTARKIYTSSPGSYHPAASFWTYYPILEKVEGDCKVHEIPLSLSYHFGHSSKQNWFASAGLSSYLMKKETYKYYYKYTPTGQTVTRNYTARDKNNNYFSVLTLSGGYQRNIGKNFSVMAEPYIKLPLGGVGLGNVKLNSGGILLSVGIKPFTHSKKPRTL